VDAERYEQDIYHIQFKADGFLYWVANNDTSLGQTGVIQYFLSTSDKNFKDCVESESEPAYSYSTNPPKTARPPYREIDSATARPRMPKGRAMGASELRATTVTPASKGPPMYRYLSFLYAGELKQ
jgi:hypothetical protein